MPLIILVLVATFLSVFLAMVSAGHFFIYYSVKKFFSLENDDRKKRILGIFLFFCAISFALSTALAHWSRNIITEDFYFFAGLWLGLALNLDIAFGFGWIIFGAGKILKKELNLKIIGGSAIALAVIFSGYGVWNAYHPQVKEITVSIKNLSVSWQGKKAVQISDIHLGHVFGKKFLQETVDKINIINPEAVFITGDLFDGMDGKDLDEDVLPLNNLKAPGGTFFVTGNHDTYFGLERTYDALAPTKVKILNDEIKVLDGLQIVGVSFPEGSEMRDIEKAIKGIKNFNPEDPSVLLYHSPFEAGRAKQAGVDLMLSGHTHAGQMFPFDILVKIIFRGNGYGLRRDGDFTLYTSSGLGSWGPTMRTFARPEIVVINFESVE